MTTDPSVQLTEVGPPTVGEPLDPNAEVLGPPEPPQWEPPLLEREPKRARRWRFGPRSLTGRLVTGVVALVAVLVVATGAGTYFELRSYLSDRLDAQVKQTATQPLGALLNNFNNPSALTIWVTELSPTGAVLDTGSDGVSVKHMQVSAADRARLAADPRGLVSVTTTDGKRLRVVVTVQNNIEGFVAIGLSTAEVHRTLHRLIVLEWWIGLGAVLVAFGATAGGVQLSLRRLRRVTATAHEVAAELSPQGTGLDRRVPVDDDDTTEVGQLADSMNTLLAAVESQFAARLESEQRMRQFLADASHELRTPLTSIRGYAELARMQRGRPATGADPENLDRIESEGTRMSRLIDDLLMLARTDQAGDEGSVPVQEYVEVDELLADVVSGARASFPARPIHLVAPPGLALVGDPDQLHRAVRNLVNNAAVHTRPDGPIGVRALRVGDDVLIQVADSGPGLSPEDAAHVFERFWRADKARTRVRGGSGLGMSIVSSIVGAHGGTVRFDSTVENGSTVTITLPSGAA